jgi:hypothetical protein
MARIVIGAKIRFWSLKAAVRWRVVSVCRKSFEHGYAPGIQERAIMPGGLGAGLERSWIGGVPLGRHLGGLVY